MRHTLLLISERKRLHHEYHIRLAIVALFIFSGAMVVGAISLFPAFMFAITEEGASVETLQTLGSHHSDSGALISKGELDLAKNMLTAVSSPLDAIRLSNVVKTIVSLRGNTKISGISVARSPKSLTVLIQGIAPTRNTLLSFKSDLESKISRATVELPIDQLIDNTDVHFSIKVNVPLK